MKARILNIFPDESWNWLTTFRFPQILKKKLRSHSEMINDLAPATEQKPVQQLGNYYFKARANLQQFPKANKESKELKAQIRVKQSEQFLRSINH